MLLRFTRAGRTFVLRRPPVHKRANSDETMRREARVLAALAGSDVPHPGLIAAEPDPEVMGAAFYLMEPVDGFNPTLGLPAPFEHDTGWQHAMGLSMADAIVALAAVDHVAVGLGDLGRFDGWAARQVGRWRAQLDSYHELPGYTGPNIPGVGVVGRDGHGGLLRIGRRSLILAGAVPGEGSGGRRGGARLTGRACQISRYAVGSGTLGRLPSGI